MSEYNSFRSHFSQTRCHIIKTIKFLQQVMSEYKNEVDSMLSEDPQLAKEVEFDMKRFEREQQEQSQLPTSNLNISKQNVRFISCFVVGQESANCGPNLALKVKICGPRGPFHPEMFISKTIKIENFIIKTYS